MSADGSSFVDALVLAGSGAASFAAPPSAPTPAAGDSSTKLATTAFVAGAVAGLVAAAPGALDTLKALADALADDPNFAATVAGEIAQKAPLASAALTGTPTAPTPAFGDDGAKIATTAYVDRAIARTQVSDAAYAVQPADRTVAIVALTAARTLTLPAASAYPQGVTLTILDESGAASGANLVTVAVPAPASGQNADTISGLSAVPISTPYGYVALQSNGLNKWTLVDTPLIHNRSTFLDVYGAQNQIVTQPFTRLQLNTVVSDPGNNWDDANFWYTCPRSGIYSIAGTARVVDGTPGGCQYGLGVFTGEQDGGFFLWHAANGATRTTYPYARLAYQNRGDQLRMYSYSDSNNAGNTTVPNGAGVKFSVAAMQVILVSDA